MLSLIGAQTSNVVILAGPDNSVKTGLSEAEDRAYRATSFAGIVGDLDQLFGLRNFNYRRIGNGDTNTVMDLPFIDSAIEQQPANTLIIILAHGLNDVKYGHLLANLAEDDNLESTDNALPAIPTKRLFDTIRNTGRPMDIVMMACQSGVNHDIANNKLPPGSRFLTLGENDEDNAKFHTWQILNFSTLNKTITPQKNDLDKISFEKILLNTLLTATKLKGNNGSPVLTVAGSGTCRFADMLKTHKGKKFTPLEDLNVRARLPEFDSIKDAALMKTIQQEPESLSRDSQLYGRALAMVLTANQMRVPLQKLTG